MYECFKTEMIIHRHQTLAIFSDKIIRIILALIFLLGNVFHGSHFVILKLSPVKHPCYLQSLQRHQLQAGGRREGLLSMT